MLKRNVNSEAGYVAEVKRILVLKGFWGRPVQKLAEELRDHFHTKAKILEAEGYSRSEANRITSGALGKPETAASEWSIAFQNQSWTGRHPWLMSVMEFIGLQLLILLTMLACYQLSGWGASKACQLRFFSAQSWFGIINWLPWTVGMGLITWQAVSFPRGWKSLILQSVALGLATSAFVVYGSFSFTHTAPLTDTTCKIAGAIFGPWITILLVGASTIAIHVLALFHIKMSVDSTSAVSPEVVKVVVSGLATATLRLILPILFCLLARCTILRLQRTEQMIAS